MALDVTACDENVQVTYRQNQPAVTHLWGGGGLTVKNKKNCSQRQKYTVNR